MPSPNRLRLANPIKVLILKTKMSAFSGVAVNQSLATGRLYPINSGLLRLVTTPSFSLIYQQTRDLRKVALC